MLAPSTRAGGIRPTHAFELQRAAERVKRAKRERGTPPRRPPRRDTGCRSAPSTHEEARACPLDARARNPADVRAAGGRRRRNGGMEKRLREERGEWEERKERGGMGDCWEQTRNDGEGMERRGTK